jgi:mycofactocin system creatininase family protein
MRLAELTWVEVAPSAARSLLVVPLGSTEQHGPHLPLSVDLDVAAALADRLDAARDDVFVAPGLPYGASGEHRGFAGTLSIGQDALEIVITELVRSADAFAGVVLVCGHGGNADPLARAAATATGEGRNVLAWAPRFAGGDAHAGRTETSMLLALDAARVRAGAAAPGNTVPIGDLMADLRAGGVASVAPNGVLGDPTGATAEEGERLLAAATGDLVTAVASWCAKVQA